MRLWSHPTCWRYTNKIIIIIIIIIIMLLDHEKHVGSWEHVPLVEEENGTVDQGLIVGGWVFLGLSESFQTAM